VGAISAKDNLYILELLSLAGVHLGSVNYVMVGVRPTHGDLVELEEAVGIMASQSIGEPGTQLAHIKNFSYWWCGGTAQHVQTTFHGKSKFNEDLLHPTRTRGILPFCVLQILCNSRESGY
jgi:hypothetical protein